MIYFWIFLLIALVASYELQRVGAGTLVRRHQYGLYELRDELREAAINGEVDPKSWVFLYLDSSIAKTINALDQITMWSLLGGWVSSKIDPCFSARRGQLTQELSKAENATLREFHQKFARRVARFITARHPALKTALSNAFLAAHFGNRLHSSFRIAAEIQTEAPERSTLQDYSPA